MDMFDAIVFTQSGLDTAIDKGITRILLCGGNFNLPDNLDITYTPVGTDTAILEVKGEKKIIAAPSSFASSYRSFAGSYRTSYTTSFLTSYRFTTSFLTSYRYWYKTSFSGSYRTSYRLSTSFASSFSASFKLTSFIGSFRRRVYDRILKEISVNGYGIHLI